jgi:hypothetical protein
VQVLANVLLFCYCCELLWKIEISLNPAIICNFPQFKENLRKYRRKIIYLSEKLANMCQNPNIFHRNFANNCKFLQFEVGAVQKCAGIVNFEKMNIAK